MLVMSYIESIFIVLQNILKKIEFLNKSARNLWQVEKSIFALGFHTIEKITMKSPIMSEQKNIQMLEKLMRILGWK